MKRFILDTGIAALQLDRKRGEARADGPSRLSHRARRPDPR